MAELKLAEMWPKQPKMLRTYQNLYQETKKDVLMSFYCYFDPLITIATIPKPS